MVPGHSSAGVTEIYAEQDLRKAAEIMAGVGKWREEAGRNVAGPESRSNPATPAPSTQGQRSTTELFVEVVLACEAGIRDLVASECRSR